MAILVAFAAGGAGPTSQAADPLAKLLADPALRGASVGVVVEDLETGERRFAHAPDRALVPASNQKLLVAAAALTKFGPAYRFETPVFVEGPIDGKGVLDGVLWLEGRGDPSLVSESLWKLAEEIRLKGITRIRGGIGVDAGYFDRIRLHPDWGRISSRAYHAPTSAFAANYSSFRVEVAAGPAPGAPARVRIAPETRHLQLDSSAVTSRGSGAPAKPLRIDLEPLADGRGERVRVRGTVPPGGAARSFWRSVRLPEFYAASLLRTQLEAHGIQVDGPIQLGAVPSSARELLVWKSDPLSLILQRQNKWSNNFIAEQLTKALGAEAAGPPGNWEKGKRALDAYLVSIGVPSRAGYVADGSGLSPHNQISPAVLVRVLREALGRFDSGPEFLSSLPLGGLDGTLRDRMSAEKLTPVRAKTGRLRRVTSLSGLVSTELGERWLFAVLVNGSRGSDIAVQRAVDRFVAELATTGRPAAAAAAAGP
ncbi:MAG: D-alanyl-D-alanine carboxypeptidase/D-alanyl-D-alanine-endopeptidase [Myxococcota bacterium]|nr:D-alanyl-D-alanine carboxypeptidase/D-alanyl-D-alanine-endopeptidase [Myxococcota bacterium]